MFHLSHFLVAIVSVALSVASCGNMTTGADSPMVASSADITPSFSPNGSTDAGESDSLRENFSRRIVGDFNGDFRKDTAVLALEDSTLECCEFDKETSFVSFSNKAIPTLVVKGDILGHIQNLGDINGDGRDEIGLYSFAGYSNFKFYYVYGLRKGKWCNVVRPFELHYDVWLDHGTDFKPIRKLSRKKVYIYTNVWNPETEWPDFTWIKVRLKR